MSRLITVTLEGREPLRLDPAKLELPGHVPDLPAVRADFALHLEGAEDIDQWVALHLEELEKRGLADNTIIFFYSDHGGCLPRGKGFPYETGYHKENAAYSALMDITAVDGRLEPLVMALREVDNFNARGIRINMGALPMSELYPPENAQQGLKMYHQRLNWRNNLP